MQSAASLTDHVAGFVVDTRASDIPDDVMHLGKRSIIDALGLALAGAASQTGTITRRFLARCSTSWLYHAAARFIAFKVSAL